MRFETIVCALYLLATGAAGAAPSSQFAYQGRLMTSGIPANGTYDLQFTLFDAPVGGNQIAPAVTNSQTLVSNGLFFTYLDFGSNIFNGTPYWLQIGVRTNQSPGDYELLLPRNPLTPTPYASFATAVPSAGISGTLPDTLLSSNVAKLDANSVFTGVVQFTNPTNSFQGVFYGDGGSLSNLNAASLVGGINTTNPTIHGVVTHGTDISSISEQVTTNFSYPSGAPQGYIWRCLVPAYDAVRQTNWCLVRRSAITPNPPWVQPALPTGWPTLTSSEFLFGTDASSFVVLLRGNGSNLGVEVDGADDWSRLYTPPDAQTHYLTVNFATSARRQVVLKLSQNYLFGGLYLPVTNGLWPGLLPKQHRMIVVGDSFSEDYASTGWISSLITLFQNVDVWSSAVGSTGYLNSGTAGRTNFEGRIFPDIIANNPEYVLFAGGINDNTITTNQAASAALYNACLWCYQAIQNNLPNCKIIVLGPFWPRTPDPGTPSLYLVNSAISNACLSAGIINNYIDTLSDPWVTGIWNQPGSGNAVNYTSSDGTHPTQAGAWNLAYHVAGEISRRFPELQPRRKTR